MAELRKYNSATTVLFPLIDRDAVDFESTPVTFAAADTKIIKDEGAAANTTNNPVHEGNGIYSLALTAAEMQAARVVITVIDRTATKLWEDQAIIVETYGAASAQHAFDLDDAGAALADELLKRAISNVEPGAGARTLYGAIAALVNRRRFNVAGDLEVFETDDSTVLATFTRTADSGAEPTKELDPS